MNRNLIITSGLLVCVMEPNAERRDNARLVIPPKLFVLHWSEEQMALRLAETSWEVAEGLAPDDMREISAELSRRRNARDAEIDALKANEKHLAEGGAYCVAGRNEVPRQPTQREPMKPCQCSNALDNQTTRAARCIDNPGIGYRCDLYGHPGALCGCPRDADGYDCVGSANPSVCRRRHEENASRG
jgi:hypothetical protein